MKIGTCIGITISKIVKYILRLTRHGGTSFPGVIARFFNKDILAYLSQNVQTILITGTNGKSTSLRILEHILNNEGIEFFSNYEGANIETGIISTFISNTSFNNQKKSKLALIECDELYVDRMCKQLHPKIILITNLYEDQKERFGSVEQLANRLNKALSSFSSILCINKDCDSLKSIYENNKNRIINYSVIGNSILIDNEEMIIKSNLDGHWNYSNLAGALAIAYALGIDIKKYTTFDNVEMPYGRMEKINIHNAEILINLAKNPYSFDVLLEYLVSHNQKDVLVIGINNKPGDIRNPNWLKDAKKLSLLNNFNNIWVCGDCADIIKEILLKEVQDISKIEILKTSKVIEKAINSNSKVAMLLNYTCLMEIRNILTKKKYITKDFWQR